jgi:hypothetical protein
VAQVVEGLLCKHEVLSSTPRPPKPNKKQNKECITLVIPRVIISGLFKNQNGLFETRHYRLFNTSKGYGMLK